MLIHMSELLSPGSEPLFLSLDLEPVMVFSGREKQSVTATAPLKLVLTPLKGRKVRIQGEADMLWHMSCDRCLVPVSVPVHLSPDIEVDFTLTAQDRIKDLDEQSYIIGYDLDVARMVLDELLVNKPAKVLCREDCKGLCPYCHGNRNLQACSCASQQSDPRMSQIRNIFNSYKEV